MEDFIKFTKGTCKPGKHPAS